MSPDSCARVLVIDDTEANRYAIARQLRRAGYTTSEAATGHDGLRLAEQQPDLILLDVKLPDTLGYDVCRKLKRNPRTAAIPVLHLSATFQGSEHKIQGLDSGADGFLTAPVEADVLLAHVRALLRMRRAEQEARRAQERLASVLGSIAEGYFALDGEWRFVAINRAAEQAVFKRPQHELIGQVIWQAYPQLRESNCFRYLHLVHETGQDAHFECQAHHPGNWFEMHASARGAEIEVYLRDITARKLADQRLRESEERFQIVALATNDAIWDWTLDDDGIWWNEGVRSLFGYGAAEVGPDIHWWFGHIHAEDRDRVVSAIRAVIDGEGTFWRDEYRFLRADGEYAEILDRGYVMRDASGRAVRMIGAMQDLTERKRAERALRASEARLAEQKQALELAVSGAPLEDVLGVLIGAAQRQFGPEASAAIFMVDPEIPRLRVCAAAGRSEGFVRAIDGFVVGPTQPSCGLAAYSGKIVIVPDVDADPAWRPYLHLVPNYGLRACWSFPIHAADGKTIGTFTIYRPIQSEPSATDLERATVLAQSAGLVIERHRTQQALHTAVQRFETLANAMPQMVWSTRPDGYHDYFNERWYEYTGMPREGDQGWAWLDYLHPDDVAGSKEAWQRSLATGAAYEVQYRFRRAADGLYRWFIGRALPVRNRAGTITRWFGTCTDITDLHEAQQALRENEAKFRAFFETAAVGTVQLDLDGCYLDVNDRYCQITGYSRDELLRMRPPDLSHPQDRTRDAEQLSEFLQGRLPVQDLEKRYVRKDGRSVWVQVSEVLIRDAEGRPQRAAGVVQDITQRKATELDLERAKQALQQHAAELERKVAQRTARLSEAVAELEHFSYTITHDMRAPLRAMRSFAQLLREDYADRLDDIGGDYLRRISEAAERMDNLILDALNYGQALQGALPLEAVDPAPLLRGMVESYPQLHPPHANVEIVGEFPAVRANQAGLIQCLSNLLSNAVKFVEPGTLPQVRVWAEPRDGRVRIWVEDNGIGIPAEQKERVFVMFQRLSKKYEGTGIGLALVRKVVERMQGAVGFESEPGHGSRFWIELARAGTADEADSRTAAAEDGDRGDDEGASSHD